MPKHTNMLGLILATWGAWVSLGHTETLTYETHNKWVTPQHNQPLQKLMGMARRGVTRFSVVLPKAQRTLSIQRLEIIRDLLTREAKQGVILTEQEGTTPPQTLQITPTS